MTLVLLLWDMLANPLMILGPIVLVVIALRASPRAVCPRPPSPSDQRA